MTAETTEQYRAASLSAVALVLAASHDDGKAMAELLATYQGDDAEGIAECSLLLNALIYFAVQMTRNIARLRGMSTDDILSFCRDEILS